MITVKFFLNFQYKHLLNNQRESLTEGNTKTLVMLYINIDTIERVFFRGGGGGGGRGKILRGFVVNHGIFTH